MLHEHEIKSWNEFDDIVKPRHYRKWIYRGQSDAGWELESSLYRAFSHAEKIHKYAKSGYKKNFDRENHESVMIEKFKANAHLYLSHLPREEDRFSWLALMQHYGAPTRLLDFSYSPYVAAFFSLESGEDDAAIYSLNHEAITESDKKMWNIEKRELYEWVINKNGDIDEAILYTFEPALSNERLLAQQGLFVMPNFLRMSHGSILKNYKLPNADITKYIIPKKLRKEGIRHLSQMNVTASILYPGLNGFCKSMLHQPIFDVKLQKSVG